MNPLLETLNLRKIETPRQLCIVKETHITAKKTRLTDP